MLLRDKEGVAPRDKENHSKVRRTENGPPDDFISLSHLFDKAGTGCGADDSADIKNSGERVCRIFYTENESRVRNE